MYLTQIAAIALTLTVLIYVCLYVYQKKSKA